VIFEDSDTVTGTTLGDKARAKELARNGANLLEQAEALAGGAAKPTQLEVATTNGSVFVVRHDKRRIVATTGPQPTSGLVFYDLKSALRQSEQQPQPKAKPKPKPKPSAKASGAAAAPKKPRAPKKKPAPPREKPDAS
jgi:hypothetical protein